MNELSPEAGTGGNPWTCPFCPLLCDAFSVDAGAVGIAGMGVGTLALQGSSCPRANAALAEFTSAPSAASPLLNGEACSLATALSAAAAVLAASRQPLFGGLATDVAGARALYRLACHTGAICDVANGAALIPPLRPQQDRGGFNTSLAEVRGRADVIVCIGGLPTPRYPEFFRRCGIGEALVPQRHVVVVGGQAVGGEATPWAGAAGVSFEQVAPEADLFTALATLASLVSGRSEGAAAPALAALASRLKAARYAVFVWEPGALPAGGELLVERVYHLVSLLNASTRAAGLPLGGDDGASTVNQVFAWLSGLPLRSRAGPGGLEHEPVCFDAERLLAEGSVDSLLWLSSFRAAPGVPAAAVPRIVIGHPAQARLLAAQVRARATVFIPVSTPGIGSGGHLFRTDSSVLMPLRSVYADSLPTAAEVMGRLASLVEGGS